VPATLIPFPQYDRRARHAVISEVSALDLANDVDALAATAITYLEPSHLLALGHNDAELVHGIAVAYAALKDLRTRVHDGLDLLAESVVVDPYLAVEYAASGHDAA
jgi:hypothetical protein